MQFTKKDIAFGAINGGIFGLMVPFVLANLNVRVGAPVFLFAFMALAAVGVYIGALLSRIRPFFFQLAKFGATGAANTAIDFGILNILISASGATGGWLFVTFKFISFLGATINSYLWNKFWSFEDKSRDDIKEEFTKFLTISGVGIFLNVGVASLINNGIGPVGEFSPEQWANISNAIAAITVLSWNFLGYKLVVFKK